MKLFKTPLSLLMLSLCIIISCSDNDENTSTDNHNSGNGNCNNPSSYVFNEVDGVIKVEFEDGVFVDDWTLSTNGNASGNKYGVWSGDQYLGTPGNGLINYSLKITTPGVYRFIWRSAITTGTRGSDHNDSWLRFADADDFYGEKNGSTVYPKGTGKTPNPNGSSADGWFKIYRSGNDLDFKWQAATSDNDAHNIYVLFEQAGIYTMEVSARSSGHAIDQFILFKEDNYSQNQALEITTFSEVTCGN